MSGFINDTGQKLLIVSEADGEILNIINENEKVIIRRGKQPTADKYYSPKVKIKGRFIKVMDDERFILDEFIDCPMSYLAINYMKRYLVPNYNVLMKNGKKYKCNDLAEDMKITRQRASHHIKILKQKNIIAEVETNKGKLLAINPEFYCASEEVPERIVRLFKKNE